jgi:hypothetical protein
MYERKTSKLKASAADRRFVQVSRDVLDLRRSHGDEPGDTD